MALHYSKKRRLTVYFKGAAARRGPGRPQVWGLMTPRVSHPWTSDLSTHGPLVTVAEAREERQKRAKHRTARLTLPQSY